MTEMEDLRARLVEAEEVLRAIRNGEVDALLITGERGDQVYTLGGADRIYRQLIETMSEGAVTLSANGVILYCNARLAEMLGRPLEPILGTTLRNYLPPADHQALDAILAQARTEPSRREINLRTSEGRLVPIGLSAFRLHSEGAEIVFCLVLTDLTEQKSHEQVVAAERLARLILEQAAEAIIVCDEQGRVIRASQAAQRFCDGSPLLRPFAEVFPLRTDASDPFHLAPVLQGKTLRNVDVTLDRQGQKSDLILNAGPLLSAQQILGCVVTLTDITMRKRAAAALSASEVQYHRLFESAKDGILILDAETGMVVDVNPFLIELLAFSREAFLGKTVWELGFFKDILANQVHFAELQEKAYVRYEDMALETADGRRIEVEFVSNVYQVNHHKVIQCNIRDVTGRKRVEAELARHREHLEVLVHEMELANEALTRKHRELQDFYHTVSHELKTPLTSNREFISIILDGLAGPVTSEQREYLNLAREGCDQIKFSLNDLLDATRLETGKLDVTPAPTRVEELVRKAVGSMEPAMRAKGITLRAEVQPGLPEIPLDERRINQVLLNLLSNALKFTPAGGTVAMRAFEDPRQPRWVQMAVSDTGQGIASEHLTRIFEKLYQVRESDTSAEGGLGMGLFIAREIVRLHGGSLWVESEVDRGSTFQFTLPKEWQRRRKTVLFVDDDERTRELVSHVLEAAGFAVQTAASGQEALNWMRRDPADLAMVDLQMPGVPGPALIGELRRGWGLLPIIVYTAYPESDLMRQAMEFSPLTLLTKQCPNETLAATVRAILEPEAVRPAPIGPAPVPDIRAALPAGRGADWRDRPRRRWMNPTNQ